MGHVVFLVCVYEAYALATGRVPTITRLTWAHRHEWWCVLLVLAAVAWLLYHLLIEKPSGV